MARSLSNMKLIPALIDGVSLSINRSRRISSVTSKGVAASVTGGSKNGISKRGGEEKSGPQVTPWVPDPVTGYYRPENRADEIDVAELRETLLNHKITHH